MFVSVVGLRSLLSRGASESMNVRGQWMSGAGFNSFLQASMNLRIYQPLLKINYNVDMTVTMLLSQSKVRVQTVDQKIQTRQE